MAVVGKSSTAEHRDWGLSSSRSVAGIVIAALVIALVRVGVVGFQSLKSDIRDTEARLTAEISRQREDLQALSGNLDRVLESLLAARP